MKRIVGVVGIVLGGLTAGCDLIETVTALVTGGDDAPSAAAEAGAVQPSEEATNADQSAPEAASGKQVAIDSNVAEPGAKATEPAAVATKASASTSGTAKKAVAAARAGKDAAPERAPEASKAEAGGEPAAKLDAKEAAKLDAKEAASEPSAKQASEAKTASSGPKPRARVRTGATFASGEVDATSAHRALRSAKGSLVACYDRALKENPESNGTISVALQIGAAGQVIAAKGGNAPGLPSHVTQCTLGVVRGLKFPLKEGSKAGTLSVPVTFTPG